MSGILLDGTWLPALLSKEFTAHCYLLLKLHLAVGERRSTPAPSSAWQQSHSCPPQTHTPGALRKRNAMEKKPCSKAKLADKPSVLHKVWVWWTLNALELYWQGDRGGRGREKRENTKCQQQKKQQHTTENSWEKLKKATRAAVVTASMCAEGGGADRRVKLRKVLKKCVPPLWPQLLWQRCVKHPFS